jgi:arylformamidase
MPIYREFTQEELDAQYNVRAGIPNYLDIFARWKSEGAEFRRATAVKTDLAYGNELGQTLDFFQAADTNSPLLVFIHGGYWQSLDKSDFSTVAKPYVEENINVAVVNYAPCHGLMPPSRKQLRTRMPTAPSA